ncbi:spore coat protein [Cohnella sp. JJ-181]|uniref:spore coat protein n=1 Tax=Cohnella rhizoplanae TaxID=2974897 RepID=UPI0022FF9DD8|nr:spore coat protein [Cohnella sp. JJ-181]CAI6046064.1 hypothetical protein COHCIP112018_01283 [Cohnella sp. JJ-181]
MAPANRQFLPDEDLAYTVLADLKRVTREYATAATESACPTVRQQFTQLLNVTLQMQGELYDAMQSAQMYPAPAPALKQDIDRSLKSYQDTQTKTQQFVQQAQQIATPAWQQQQSSGQQHVQH